MPVATGGCSLPAKQSHPCLSKTPPKHERKLQFSRNRIDTWNPQDWLPNTDRMSGIRTL
jgi:hypothetical protein